MTKESTTGEAMEVSGEASCHGVMGVETQRAAEKTISDEVTGVSGENAGEGVVKIKEKND